MTPRPYFKLDQFHVSIQAGEYIYCTPRNNQGPWVQVELGFPSEVPPAPIMEYCESIAYPTETVYAYVPVELVVSWLQSKGATREQLEAHGFKETTDGVMFV